VKNLIYLFFFFSFFSFSQEEKRLALVIGNSEYIKGPLKNPVNDASLIAKTLEGLDFEVMLYKNLKTRASMLKAISEFGQKRPLYDVGFIYYAGHGIQVNNENFLIPTDELINNKLEVEDYAVSLQKILRYLESSGVSNNINFLVLDACRDNPYEMSWSRSSKGNGLAKTPPPTGSLIAFSTDSNQTAADGDGDNSLYSLSLSKNLTKENISIEQVFKNVLTEVLDESENTQSPVYESKLTGSTYALNRTFSVYNSTSQEIIDFTDTLLIKGSLLDALKILDDAANYFKSEKEIKNEIKIRSKIINTYLFYESQKEINIQSESYDRFDFNFNTIKTFRQPTSEMFNDLFDKLSYDIFIRNYTYLLSNNKKDYLENINYPELITLAFIYNYQMATLTVNNSDIDFFKGMILNPLSLTEIENIIKNNKIDISGSPLLMFWKNKNDYLKYRLEYFTDSILISSIDELNDTLLQYSLDTIDKLRKLSISDDFSTKSVVLNKILTLTKEIYPSLNVELKRMINDIIYFSKYGVDALSQREIYELFKIENKTVLDFISNADYPDLFISDQDEYINLDLNWFFLTTEVLYTTLIHNLGHNSDEVKDIVQILKNNKKLVINHDLFLDELLTTKDNARIEKFNNFVKNNSFRINSYLNYRDYVFSENEIKIDSLFRKKVATLKDVHNYATGGAEAQLDNYNSAVEEDYTDVIKYIDDFFNYPSGSGSYGAFFYSIMQYVKNSSYSKEKSTINNKILEFERKLKLNEIIKNSLLSFQGAVESTTKYGSIWIRQYEVPLALNFIKQLSDFSEFESDEYLIINYFILKNIIKIDKQSSIIWDFDDIVKRYNELTALADSKDDYLFKINIQQTFDEFINNIDFSNYKDVYSQDQLAQIKEIVSSY